MQTRRLRARWSRWVAAAAAAMALSSGAAHACDCGVRPSPREAFEEATVVFEGRSITELREWNGTVRFQVLRAWKGEVGPEITLASGSDGSLMTDTFNPCDFFPRRGETYVVYARMRRNEMLAVPACGRTRRLDTEAAEDVAELGDIPKRALPPLPEPLQRPQPEAPRKASCGCEAAGAGGGAWPLAACLAALALVARGRRRARETGMLR
jgi:hypothetical protein